MEMPVSGPSPAYDEKLILRPVDVLGVLKLTHKQVNWKLVVTR